MISREEFLSKYTSHLNEKQVKAVQTISGPVLLLAVPGSGKTTVLVNRLGYMLYVEGINPGNILTLTYTIAATQDMKRRFEDLFGEDYSGKLEFRTINGICAKIIDRYGKMIGKDAFELITDEKSLGRMLSEILSKYLQDYPTESDIKGAKQLITYCKNMMLSDDEIERLGNDARIPLLDVYRDYNAALKAAHQMDYDDQMVTAHKLLSMKPDLLSYYRDLYRYICVDEAQDTSKIQHEIIGMLSGRDGNLFMVGDEDQSIYGFRAAYPEALLNFEKDHPTAQVLVMDQNYRSGAKIVAAADLFIRRNKERHEKHMVATRDEGADIRYIDLNTRANQYGYLLKLAQDCSRETGVLYRENESAIPIIDRLDRQGLPYRIKSVDMSFFTGRVVTDVTNIMRFALNPADTDLFMRVYFKCQTYLKKDQAHRMCTIAEANNICVLDAAGNVNGINGMILGKCRALATNLKKLADEPPSKALFRIENPMGYGEYLERNGIDQNKLYILKQLAYNENTVSGFLRRLDDLQDMLKRQKTDYNCPFILSTIHSSKGLEYDRVFLLDVCNGVFPNKIGGSGNAKQDKKDLEEERRLFYVGMTRAKNELNIFRIADEESQFIRELNTAAEPKRNISTGDVKKSPAAKPIIKVSTGAKGMPVSDYELVIGERVISKKYGAGVISDVIFDENTKAEKFDVSFDSGEEKTFVFPIPFVNDMRLESGEAVKIEYVVDNTSAARQVAKASAKASVKPAATVSPKKTVRGGKEKYTYWSNSYPDHVVIKREGYFFTCRGESAETVSSLLGFNLGESAGKPVTGCPRLEPITEGLRSAGVSFIVVEDGEITDQYDA